MDGQAKKACQMLHIFSPCLCLSSPLFVFYELHIIIRDVLHEDYFNDAWGLGAILPWCVIIIVRPEDEPPSLAVLNLVNEKEKKCCQQHDVVFIEALMHGGLGIDSDGL